MKHLRYKLEIGLARLALLVVPSVPRRPALFIARRLGDAAYGVSRNLRRIGMANLDIVYGDTLEPAAKRAILRSSFQTFAVTVMDIFWFTRHTDSRLHRYVEWDPAFDEHLAKAPLICITGHFGNWETLGMAACQRGFPLHSVAAALNNAAVNALFVPGRELSGQTIVPAEGAFRKLLRALKDGGRVAMLLDQNTKPSEGGVFVPFFGLPVPMALSAAQLAIRTRSYILFGFATIQPNGCYRAASPVYIRPDEYGTDDKAVDDLTLRIAGHLEDAIREDPGSWLWMYKRWKHLPPGADRSAYPHYARALQDKERAKTRVLKSACPAE